jgi:glycosyltransferase involved in cell wall biosynthesis
MMGMFEKLKSFVKRAWRSVKARLIGILKRFLPQPVKNAYKSFLRLIESPTTSKNRILLADILEETRQKNSIREIIIFPPSLDWDVQLFQRPQQLALALAKQGALVFYIQPKRDRKQPPFKSISERLYLCNVHEDTFSLIVNPLIYLLTWNSEYAKVFKKPRIVYDFVDDIDVFYGDHKKIVKGHQFLLQNAALVLATAQKLVEDARIHRPDVVYSPNGVVYDHFAQAAQAGDIAPPEDMKTILSNSRPVIGYYGALARWFDYDLLKAVVELRPEYNFVLIGPDYDATLNPAGITHLTNIHWLGVKPYRDLPHYLKFFDVATIPFIVNDITNSASPLKLFEYMAGEKPVVATPMRESMHYPGVLIANDAHQFAQQLDAALKIRNDPAYRDQLRRTALDNTWERRAEGILHAIEKLP